MPTKNISLGKLKIKAHSPVRVNDDWQRDHYSGSVMVEEDGHNGLIDRWVYFHALLADSRLPIYVLHAKGEEPSSFQISKFDNKTNEGISPRVIYFDPIDFLPAVYLEFENVPKLTYTQAYKSYTASNETYLSALKNYFVAQDINYHMRLRYIDTSYWQIVMLISSLECLLPQSKFCKGKCDVCGKGLNHLLGDPARDWNELLFDKITDKKVRKQYRDILDETRWRIRNDTVHNGLTPGKATWQSARLPNGKTEFTTEKSLSGYRTDRHSLEGLIDLLRQICRYTLLDEVLHTRVFPPLTGIEVNSMTITSTKSPTMINIAF